MAPSSPPSRRKRAASAPPVGDGRRFGIIGCILLFSLSTNAYLIYLFHQTSGLDAARVHRRTRDGRTRAAPHPRAAEPFWAEPARDRLPNARGRRRTRRVAQRELPMGKNHASLRGRIKSSGGGGAAERDDNDGQHADEEGLSQDGEQSLEENDKDAEPFTEQDEQQAPNGDRNQDGARDVGGQTDEMESPAEKQSSPQDEQKLPEEGDRTNDGATNADADVESPAEEKRPDEPTPDDEGGPWPKRRRGSEVWPKPEGWETMGFYDIRLHFDCSKYARDQSKRLPTLKDWNFLKRQYREIVDDAQTFDDPVPPTDGYTFGDGGPPPYYAAHSKDGRGRGLFASRDIRKGELVHDGERSDILVPSGAAWRKFVFSLPRNKACDVVDWTWTQKTEPKGKWKIFTAMNISILLNGGNRDTWNVNPKSSTSSKMYALRDIKKGEELLTDYEIYETLWHKVGLGSEDEDGNDDAASDEETGDAEEENKEEKEEGNEPAIDQDEEQRSGGSKEDAKEGEAEVPPEKDSPELSKSGDGAEEAETKTLIPEKEGQSQGDTKLPEKAEDLSSTEQKAPKKTSKLGTEERDTKHPAEKETTSQRKPREQSTGSNEEGEMKEGEKELPPEKESQSQVGQMSKSNDVAEFEQPAEKEKPSKSAQRQQSKKSNEEGKTREGLSEKESKSQVGQPSKSGHDAKESETEAQEKAEDQTLSGLEVWPKPDGWQELGFHAIRLHFDCSTYAHDQTKPLPTLEDWQFFREKFIELVDGSRKFDDPVPPTDGHTLTNGEPTPYYAAHSKDGKGRGLFASRDIKKGELVEDGDDRSNIIFPTALSWRRYIFNLPRNKACDMIDWTWTQQISESGDGTAEEGEPNLPWLILAVMDISGLMNTGEETDWNVNPKSSTSSKMYALRDIKKGEELLTDYEIYETVWDKVGLGSEEADDDDDEQPSPEQEKQPSVEVADKL